jgi:hypothetical protein
MHGHELLLRIKTWNKTEIRTRSQYERQEQKERAMLRPGSEFNLSVAVLPGTSRKLELITWYPFQASALSINGSGAGKFSSAPGGKGIRAVISSTIRRVAFGMATLIVAARMAA